MDMNTTAANGANEMAKQIRRMGNCDTCTMRTHTRWSVIRAGIRLLVCGRCVRSHELHG
jgi:hypothetical protein